MSVRVHPLAWRELEAAARWCDRERPGAGRQLEHDARYTFFRVATAPLQGSAYFFGTRRFILRRFPYSTVYVALDVYGHVLAVAHHRRRPGYWRRRLRDL